MRRIAYFDVDDNPIASGGMGQIFRGEDDKGNIVAIKEILPEFANDSSIRTRIEKEVEFLSKCDHPSIVKLHLAFCDETTQNYYIIMEMVEGLTIEQYVLRNGPIREAEAVEIMIKILDALQCVHNAHIIHRDIKPSNIMIRPNGNVCLLDFGIAKDMENYGSNSTIFGSVIGTDGYMSPEQANGYSVSYNTDIYSSGCVLYFMLTGHHAFNKLGSDFETKDAILSSEFPRLSKYNKNLSEDIQNILDIATDKDMRQRYQSCYDFIRALSGGTQSDTSSIVITIGREKCDIIVNDASRKISRHHADVEYKIMTGQKYYIFTDCSANGSIVNGRVLHHASVNIPENGRVPEIYLAGVVEGKLDWNKVVTELNNRRNALVDANVVVVEKEEKKYVPEEAPVTLVIAFLFAILGGWLGIALGLHVAIAKIKSENGEKVYKYKDTHRYIGLIASILGVVMAACVFIIYNLNK